MSRKILIANDEFLENVDEEFIDSFVSTPSGLPILLMNILDESVSDIELKRQYNYQKHPEFEVFDQKEVEITAKLLKESKFEEAELFQINYALEFLEEYPQFKDIIKGVESTGFQDLKIMANSIREAFLGDFDYF